MIRRWRVVAYSMLDGRELGETGRFVTRRGALRDARALRALAGGTGAVRYEAERARR